MPGPTTVAEASDESNGRAPCSPVPPSVATALQLTPYMPYTADEYGDQAGEEEGSEEEGGTPQPSGVVRAGPSRGVAFGRAPYMLLGLGWARRPRLLLRGAPCSSHPTCPPLLWCQAWDL